MKFNLRCRKWLINWMYLLSFLHLITGVLMAWFSDKTLFYSYHQTVITQFGLSSQTGLPIQQWWASLFGATLQNLAIFIALLIYLGDKYRNRWIWFWMIVALIIWAPQDILISLKVDLWLHVWVDILALTFMLPPLAILLQMDRQ